MRILTMILGLSLFGPPGAGSQPLSGHAPAESSCGTALRHRSGNHAQSSDKPKFPPLDEARKITKRQRVITYPRLSINAGIAFRRQNNALLSESFAIIESDLGVPTTREFSDYQRGVFTLGLRLHVSRTFAFWWDYAYRGGPRSNEYRVGAINFSALYTFTSAESPVLISVGPGVALQSLKARRDYYYTLTDSGILKHIEVETRRGTGFSMTALLELRNPRAVSAPRVYICGRYVIDSDRSETGFAYTNSGAKSATVRTRMRGYWLTAGVCIPL